MDTMTIRQMVINIFCLLGLVSVVFGAKLPSNFKRCSVKDNECLKDAVSDAIFKMLPNGIPEFNVPQLKTLKIPKMTIGAGASVVNLVQNYENVNIKAYENLDFKNAHFDLEKGKISFDAFVKYISLSGKYDINGKILVLPVQGNGDCLIQLYNVTAHEDFDVEVVTKKNKKFLKFKDSKLRLDAGFASYRFDNLFNGDKSLGDPINKVINENWKEIYDEVAGGYEQAIAFYNVDIANKIFSKVPLSNVFLDENL